MQVESFIDTVLYFDNCLFPQTKFEHLCYTRGGGIIESFKRGGSISKYITPYSFVCICTILIEKGNLVDLSYQKGTYTPLQAYLRIILFLFP